MESDVVCPQRIGSFQLGDTIGQGHFAVVKTALHVFQGSLFACKIIRRKRIQHTPWEAQFQQEIRLLQQLNSPYIVQLCDLLKDSLNFYLIMEFCPKGDLFHLLSEIYPNNRVSEADARRLFKQIVRAVDFMHSRNIAHRDLKLENILIDKNGSAKLSDFGLARYSPEDCLASTSCGSPHYAAPEVILKQQYCPQKADMWSLGVILYVIFTGTLPWRHPNNAQQLFQDITTGKIKIPPTVPSICAELITNLLNRDPNARPSASEVLRNPWVCGLRGDPDLIPETVPVVSLKRVDWFFETDDDEFEVPQTLPRSCSTPSFALSYDKLSKMLMNDLRCRMTAGEIRLESSKSSWLAAPRTASQLPALPKISKLLKKKQPFATAVVVRPKLSSPSIFP